MRCYICDQLMIQPKDDPMTGKLAPCDKCQKVIDEAVFVNQIPNEDYYDPVDPDNLLLEDDWDEYEQIDLEQLRFCNDD